MKRHFNKKWLLDKEYISLKVEDNIKKQFSYTITSREVEIENKIYHKFFHKECRNAPKTLRQSLNRSQRSKSKQTLIKILKGYDIEFNDNYKDVNWWYF